MQIFCSKLLYVPGTDILEAEIASFGELKLGLVWSHIKRDASKAVVL